MIRLVARMIRAAWYLGWTLLFVVGLPWALVQFIGWPLPRSLPDAQRLADWVDHPLAAGRSLKMLAIVLWLVWTGFVALAAMETYGRIRGLRMARIRLATPLHGIAAGMVGATATALSAAAAHAAPPPAPLNAAVATVPEPAAQAGETAVPTLAPAPASGARYGVATGDRLTAIADRFLGDPDAYPRLAAGNPRWETEDSRFPDHIEPGWLLDLPPDAHDRGPRRHATGHVIEPGPPAQPAPAQPAQAQPPAAVPQPTSVPGPAPPHQAVDGQDESDDVYTDDKRAGQSVGGGSDTGTLAGAGLLTTLILRALTAARRRQQPYFPAGVSLPNPRGGRTERRLLAAQRPADVDRLDTSLRDLAAVLAGRSVLPDLFGVRVVGGDVHLLLTAAGGAVPAPWLDDGTQWVLPAYHELSTPDPAAIPPLPALATVGSRSGRHLMLDLERLGTLSIGGNPERAAELLTYIACELALSVWSEHVTVELAGFGDDGELVAELNPDRVILRRDPAAAVAELRTLVAVDAGTLGAAERFDTFATRLRNEPTDPRVLLVARPDEHVRADLAALDRELAAAGRCGIAAVATTRGEPVGAAVLTLTDTGTLEVDLPWLRLSTDAAALPPAELEPLAEIMRWARVAIPSPASGEPPAWSDMVDPMAAAPTLYDPAFAPTTIRADTAHTATTQASTSDADRPEGAAVDRRDPGLDDDLAAWHDPHTTQPKIAILGRVTVFGQADLADADQPDAQRHRRHRRQADELAVFLFSRPDQAANREQIEDALWSGEPVNQVTSRGAVTGLRGRLGTRDDGTPWLSDNVGRPGTPYQLRPGVLFDWHLFCRLRDRAARGGPAGAGADDLHAALALVRGVPFEDIKDSTGHRQTYTWLPESSVASARILPAITDVAHRLAQHHLANGDTATVRWAVAQAWLADPYHGTDALWLDLMHAERADNNNAAVHTLLDELLKAREAEVPEDLPPTTYQALRDLLPDRT